jgi:uncharacterized membrane protein
MSSKVNILGHPVHPMLVAYPIAFNTATLVAFIIYGVNGDPFWLKMAIALNAAAVVMAIVAAIPGLHRLGCRHPQRHPGEAVGRVHMGLNVAALVLFIISFFSYYRYWYSLTTGATAGIVLTAIGVALTIAAGFQGWALVQTHHVGVR